MATENDEGGLILYRHGTCGASVSHELVCATCGRLDDRADVQAWPGPGMPDDRAERINRRLAAQTPIPGNAATRDPQHPHQLQQEFNGGDSLHPSPSGLQAMADSIPLDFFRK